MTNDTYLPETDMQAHDDLASTHVFDDGQDGSSLTHTDLSYLHEHDSGGHNDHCTEHGGIVGTPDYDAHYWEHQTTPFSCAVQAQRGIIEAMTGEPVSEAQLCTEAAERGWLTSADGTTVEDTGNLLELHGVETHSEMDASVGDIYQELALGHKVITGIRAEDIWDADNPLQDFGSQGANHAIWVTGIDKTDPNNIKVIINDSGDPDGAGKSYPLNEFMNAWGQSGYFYLATDGAPPDLHEHIQDFNSEQGAFTVMIDWMHDHLPDAQTLLTDMMLLSCAMDVGSNLAGAKISRTTNGNHAKQSTAQIENKPTDTQANPLSADSGQSNQKKSNPHDCNKLNRHPTTIKDEQPAVPRQEPPEPQANAGQNAVVQEPNGSLADAIKNKILDDWREWDLPKEVQEPATSENAVQQTETTSVKNSNNGLMAKKPSVAGGHDHKAAESTDVDAKEAGNVIFLKTKSLR